MCYEYFDLVKPQTLNVKKEVVKKVQKAMKTNSKVPASVPLISGYPTL